ncbi:hypothetical protein KZP23_18300 [Echinicola marina]|uniref:hypothetical protein n=1 Tax=Echinicola marina TaxID=2859768 RepID=UPI001CF6C9BA|nr:hypothetical protein [Echinicola marina]UCS92620.1 hypothetical protein KZP23_18300 [Echinicola marina]
MEERLITAGECEKLMEKLSTYTFQQEYQPQRNTLTLSEGDEKKLQIRFPIYWHSAKDHNRNQLDQTNYVLLMIRSGIAAIGYFENGENMDHKVFRAYMVRKKQGKSQIKHLKTKGKSRAGSRVRLAETLEFFEGINERLQYYFNEFRIDKIGLSCSTTLIPYLFGSKISTPFEKNDDRLFKIPKHIPNPTYEALLATNDFMLKSEVQFDSSLKELIYGVIEKDAPQSNPSEEEEDW